MSLNIELLEQSFERVKPYADEFTASFYENLFDTHPEIKLLFNTTDMAKQEKKLLQALALVVENLRSPDVLGQVLSDLGARHVGYGAIAKHYRPFGEAILKTFSQYLEQDWTPELEKAWQEAYRKITFIMLRGAGVESSPKEEILEAPKPEEKTASAASTKTLPELELIPNLSRVELKVELLESSFEKVKPQVDEFAASFYENLFDAHPEVKPLFNTTDMAKQEKKLMQALALVVENLRSPDVLGQVLSNLGARHVGYGAIAKHYRPVGEAILKTFSQYLEQDWTPEVEKAWQDAYRTITFIMLKGAESSQKVPEQEAVALEKPRESKVEKKESQQPQPLIEQQKKSLISIESDGAILKQIERLKTLLSLKQWSEILTKIPGQILETFWVLPVWVVAVGSGVIMTVVFVLIDDNSLFGKVLGGSDAISMVVALVLFIKEAPARQKQFHYQAWSTVDAAHGVKVSNARILALQDLNKDGVSLRGLDVPRGEFVGIDLSSSNLSAANLNQTDFTNANLSHANLDHANLSQTKLSGANLSHATLSFARLSQANLNSANLSSANLICADLSNANMSGVNLKNASLSGSNLKSAYLSGANLKGAKVSISELNGALLEGAIMPDGSKYSSISASSK
ncbi:MAG: pentapeptide repeat-containing protein [Rhizonema sp. NSF051]|nr:pentapeptide repeat-containing protein [Rhizonema sp. NSF051]